MKGFGSILPAALAMSVSGVAAKLSPVSIKGNAFFNGTDRFYIRGVDYQPGGSSNIVDPLASGETCKRDIEKFVELGLNTIRVYTVDNSANHDECMSALEDAGIYLILDVNSPKYSLNRMDPHASYNSVYLQNIFATMDMFSKYDNTLAFFSGNEVINETTQSTVTAPYVKAVTRDMKQYQGNRGLRRVPVGYSAADVSSNRQETAEYMNCGTDDERSDFFAFNDYSWCDPSSFQISGWDQKVKNFSDYSLPIFLSEHGCNKNKRTFGDISALYSTEMTGVYSGGLVYEYSQEASDYGLVDVKGGSVQELPDFAALKKAYAGTPPPKGSGGYRANPGGPSKCPARSSVWLPGTDALPSIPDGAKSYMTDGAGPGKGLTGPGSQNAGGVSTGTATAGSGQPSRTASYGSGSSSNAASSVKVPAADMFVPAVLTTVLCLSSLVGSLVL